MPDFPIVIYTDGAASGNPGPGGWGAIVATPEGEVHELGGARTPTTNNAMELQAAIEGLRAVREIAGPLVCFTDSTYVLRGASEWMTGWKRRGWARAGGATLANSDAWQEISREIDRRGGIDSIDWRHVPGHSQFEANERADTIAVAYSRNRKIKLYHGPLGDYGIPMHDLLIEPIIEPARKERKLEKKRRRTPALSYLSLVDGKPMRHRTWSECEQRVKGVSKTRYKKATTRDEEREILESWGYRISDLIDSP